MPRAVVIERRGSIGNLAVRHVRLPEPAPNQVRVRIRAAGLNAIDWKIVERPAAWEAFAGRARPPIGNGTDFAGVVHALGHDIDGIEVGDAVFGGRRFQAQADFLVATTDELHPVPEGLSFEQAGALDTAARAAAASLRSVEPQPGETVLVSAAAGGVGILVAQLARLAGARVIGTAGPRNHDFLRRLGIEPVEYGPGLLERLRELAPGGIDAVLDNHGRETLAVARDLGVRPRRINSIADRGFAADLGGSGIGGAAALPGDVDAIARRIADGELEFPVDSTFRLHEVVPAYARLRAGHVRGKVVLVT